MTGHLPELRHIEAFLAVARCGNFTRAAADLHVSQPALTVQIRQLESTLGLRLFDRNNRRVSLTQPGRERAYVASGPPRASTRRETIAALTSSERVAGGVRPAAASAASASDWWWKK